jgi:hypothetical protein
MRPPWAAHDFQVLCLMAVQIPLARSRAPERLPKKGFALFEAQPSLQSPGSIEEYPMRGINSGHPACGGTSDTGALSLVPFLWASKEMNKGMETNYLTAGIVWQSARTDKSYYRSSFPLSGSPRIRRPRMM